MKRISLFTLLAMVVAAAVGQEFNLTGSWRWQNPGGDNQRVPVTGKLTQEGAKLTGKVVRTAIPDSPISEGVVSSNSVSFRVVRERAGFKFEASYKGTIENSNTIRGRVESNVNGDKRSSGWLATRVDPQTMATGSFKWSYSTQGGQTVSVNAKVKHQGGIIEGTCTGRDGHPFPISNGHFKDGKISFDVIRERDGKQFTNSFSGVVGDDNIKGKMWVDRGVERHESDWSAQRTN